MEPKQMLKQVIDLNKAAFDNTFKNITLLQEQMEKAINMMIEQSTGMTEEAKKVMKDWTAIYKRGFEDYKRMVNENFERVESFFKQAK